jgi:hypothetical protein
MLEVISTVSDTDVIECVSVQGFQKDGVNGVFIIAKVNDEWRYVAFEYDQFTLPSFVPPTVNVIPEFSTAPDIVQDLDVNILSNITPPSPTVDFKLIFAYRLNDTLNYAETDLDSASPDFTFTSLTTAVVDSNNNTGFYPSISTMPIEFSGIATNIPHIAYYSKDGNSVKYAVREFPSVWRAFSVNNYKNESDIVTSLSLTEVCVNDEGEFRPIIAYYNCTEGRLEISHGVYDNYNSANDWKLTTTSCTSDAGQCPSASLITIGDSGSYPAVSYYNATKGSLQITVSESKKGYPWCVGTLYYLIADGSEFNVDADEDISFVFGSNKDNTTSTTSNLKLDELF